MESSFKRALVHTELPGNSLQLENFGKDVWAHFQITMVWASHFLETKEIYIQIFNLTETAGSVRQLQG